MEQNNPLTKEKNFPFQGLESQKKISNKDDLPRMIAGFAELEQSEELEEPPSWFAEIVRKMADSYFDPKSFESEEMYERLGVKTYKKYLPTGDVIAKLVWKLAKKNQFVNGSSEADLRKFENQTRFYETVHTILMPVMTAFIGMSLAYGSLDSAAFIAALNTLTNVYPIMLQRYNRLRLYRVISVAHKREERPDPRSG